MYEIRLELKKQYPELINRLLPTWYIINLKENIEISDKYKNIHNNLGFFSRKITQCWRRRRHLRHWGTGLKSLIFTRVATCHVRHSAAVCYAGGLLTDKTQ